MSVYDADPWDEYVPTTLFASGLVAGRPLAVD